MTQSDTPEVSLEGLGRLGWASLQEANDSRCMPPKVPVKTWARGSNWCWKKNDKTLGPTEISDDARDDKIKP